MAQIVLSDDQKAAYRALAAAQAVQAAGHNAAARTDDALTTALFGEYDVPTPVQYVIIKTDETGEAGVFEYADLATMQTAVAAME